MTKKNSNPIDTDSVLKVENALYTKAISTDDDAAAAQKHFWNSNKKKRSKIK